MVSGGSVIVEVGKELENHVVSQLEILVLRLLFYENLCSMF